MIVFHSQNATSMWQLSIVVPKDRFISGNTIDFNDCENDAGPCNATVVEAFINGTTITKTFVRAINIVDPNAGYTNQVTIEEARLVRTQNSIGDLKLFFAEYSAEIPVDAGMP